MPLFGIDNQLGYECKIPALEEGRPAKFQLGSVLMASRQVKSESLRKFGCICIVIPYDRFEVGRIVRAYHAEEISGKT